MYRSDEGRWGCLTSGDFYFLRKKVNEEDGVVGYELFELEDIKAHDEDGMSKVMGILIHLVGHFPPSMSDLVNLEEEEDEDWAAIGD